MLFPESVDRTLQTELAAYYEQCAGFQEHEGEYVVMQGETPLGFYPDFETALEAGYEKYGLDPFLVKEVYMDELSPLGRGGDHGHAELPPFKRPSSSLRTARPHHRQT